MDLESTFSGESKKYAVSIKDRLMRTSKPSVFPNTTVKGFYDYWSQVVILQSLEQSNILDLKAALAKRNNVETFNNAKKIIPLMYHEYTHWLDNTSTLWGLTQIFDIFSCYDLWVTENNTGVFQEQEYHRKKQLIDSMKTISFPEYYTTLTEADNCHPWQYTHSMGKLFSKDGNISNYPIFFTRFSNTDGQQIARQPFSLAAVLETSAIAQEFSATSHLILSLIKGDEIFVEEKLFKNEVIQTIYEPELTVYSVAAHHVANSFKISDVLEAYGISAILSRFVLNLPDEIIETIDAYAIYGRGNVFSDGFQTAFKHHDRGVLFYYIIELLSKFYTNKQITSLNFEDSVVETFENQGINLKEVKVIVEAKMRQITKDLSGLKQPYLLSLAINSACNFQRLGLFGKPEYNFNNLVMPGVLLGDDTYFNPSGATDNTVVDRYLALSNFSDSLYKFNDACISRV